VPERNPPVSDQADLALAPIYPALPGLNGSWDMIPDGLELIGATVVAIGMFDPRLGTQIEGRDSSLVIDYRPAGSNRVRRVVLDFSDLGMTLIFPTGCDDA
jgi:hypothetical protein